MNDLFLSTKSKKEQLYDWVVKKGRCRTSDIIRWGLENYHTRAERDARDLAQEGKIWRVKDIVKMAIAPKSKEDLWSVYAADR